MSKRRGNIAPETSYDPFPRGGLVEKYEPYIRAYADDFCRRYPHLGRDEVLFEAVQLACMAEKKFKPELGNDFSTFLGGRKGRPGYLKALHRLARRENWGQAWSTPRDTAANLKREREDELKETELPPGDFSGGANGTRITLDLNGVKNRATLRVQVGSVLADRILALWDRASADIHYLAQHHADPMVRIARIRAAFDHHERRQDEIEQEAENRSRGDFSSVFLEAKPRSGGVNLKHRKRRKPPNLEPDRIIMASLDDAYTHDEDWVGKLSDTIADGATPPSVDSRILDAFEAERPFLNRREAPVADWLIGWLTGIDSRTLVQFADDQKISKGYASKLRVPLVLRGMTMTDLAIENLVGRIAGVIFEAIAASLASEQEELAVDVLRRAAWNTHRSEDARILGIVGRMSDEELEALRRKVSSARPNLKVIQGGAA